jgi:hypothetical protein
VTNDIYNLLDSLERLFLAPENQIKLTGEEIKELTEGTACQTATSKKVMLRRGRGLDGLKLTGPPTLLYEVQSLGIKLPSTKFNRLFMTPCYFNVQRSPSTQSLQPVPSAAIWELQPH